VQGYLYLDEVSGSTINAARTAAWVGLEPVLVGETTELVILPDGVLHYGSEPAAADYGLTIMTIEGDVQLDGALELTNAVAGIDLGAGDSGIEVVDDGSLVSSAQAIIVCVNANGAAGDDILVSSGSYAKLALAGLTMTGTPPTATVGTALAVALGAPGFYQEIIGGVPAPYQDIRSLIEAI
jgi:hypothetical protein